MFFLTRVRGVPELYPTRAIVVKLREVLNAIRKQGSWRPMSRGKFCLRSDFFCCLLFEGKGFRQFKSHENKSPERISARWRVSPGILSVSAWHWRLVFFSRHARATPSKPCEWRAGLKCRLGFLLRREIQAACSSSSKQGGSRSSSCLAEL